MLSPTVSPEGALDGAGDSGEGKKQKRLFPFFLAPSL